MTANLKKQSRPRNHRQSGARDPNAIVKVGMIVNGGKFTKKGPDFLVVTWKIDGKRVSGVLHVSEFPSLDRNERNKMFAVANLEDNIDVNGVVVIETKPPKEGKYFTRVRLSALKPLKDLVEMGVPTEALDPQRCDTGGGGRSRYRKPKPKPKHRSSSSGGEQGGRYEHPAQAGIAEPIGLGAADSATGS